MRRIERTLVSHACDICGTEYKSKAKTKECESRSIEKPAFKIGAHVQIRETRECSRGGKYTAEGIVKKIAKPLPPDYEYEVKWLGGNRERLASHVRRYIVAYTCPCCGEKREHPVFAPEIVALERVPQSKIVSKRAIDKRTRA